MDTKDKLWSVFLLAFAQFHQKGESCDAVKFGIVWIMIKSTSRDNILHEMNVSQERACLTAKTSVQILTD